MLFKQSDLGSIKEASPWFIEAVQNLESVVTKENFPCTFGTQGYKSELHYLSFLNYPYNPKELSEDIKSYLQQIELLNERESGLAGLLVYFEPLGEMSIHSKQFLVWNLLSNMKKLYDKEEEFEDPKSEDYAFRFMEELWFINFSSNSYSNRRSRNLKSFISLALQTFAKSDRFFKSNNRIKARAQQTIRTLATKFDGCPVHPGLGPIIGDEEPFPIKYSYFIGNTNEEPSFEPWNYTPFTPDRMIIDGKDIEFRMQEFEEFIKLDRDFPISIIGEPEKYPTLKDSQEFIVTEQINDYLKSNTLLVSSDKDLLKRFKEVSNICLIGNGTETDCNNNVGNFYIAHFNDLLALYC